MLPPPIATGAAGRGQVNGGVESGFRGAARAPRDLGWLVELLGVDSFSILLNHRSFQQPAVSPGFFTVS